MGLENLSQRSRFWLFVILTTVTLIGYSVLSRVFLKDQKQEQAQATGATKPANEKKDTAPAGKNDVPAKKDVPKEPVKEAAPVVNKMDDLTKILAARGEEKQHTLGDDTTKIKVVFSERGAAIRSMTLNEHEGSDRQTGQRLAPDANGKRPRLTLVSDDEMGDRLRHNLAAQFEMLSYRLGILNEDDSIPPEMLALPWKQLGGATKEQVSYAAEAPSRNLKITKVFTLSPGEYHVQMELQFAAIDSAKPVQPFKYELTGPCGLPVEGLRWKQFSFRNYVFVAQDAENPTKLIRNTEGMEKLNKEPDKNIVMTVSDPKKKSIFLYGGVAIQFFTSLAVIDFPKGEAPPQYIEQVKAEYAGPDTDAPPYYKDRQGKINTSLKSYPVLLDKNRPQTHKYLLYAGPTKQLLLKYERNIAPDLVARYCDELHLNYLTDSTDYPNFKIGNFTVFPDLGITGLLIGSTNMMHVLLEWLHSVVRNYGLAIILMTVLVRLLLFPLSRKQAQNQAKMQEQMKVLRPEMDALKKKYANDRQAYALAQMELFKKHKMSPLAGCNGCWILLLQMPVFLGLYFALRESMHLRMSGFLWIDNLAMPDMLIHWGDNFLTNLPISFLYLGPYLHILPIIAVTVMYIYQKLMAPPAMDEQQEQQIKMMNYMTLIMGLAFYWVASGLCLYFIVSSLWGMVERKFVKKAKDAAVAQWQEKRDKDKETPEKEGGIRGKLGDLWRELQNKADKRS